jgi:putative hemolysin
MPAVRALDVMKEAHTRLAFVIDEHGGVEGLITINGIVEELVGDMPQPRGGGEPLIVQREDGSWLLDGRLPIEAFKTRFSLDELPGEDDGTFQTIGGFVIQQIGHIPAVSNHFNWGGLRFEVVDMDGPRVDKVLVQALHPGASVA